MIDGRVLTFQCKLASPFHSRRQDYTNLWKCAPFILGSTLRGAFLTSLIAGRYTQEQMTARDYERDGPAAAFFDSTARIGFSFGRFDFPAVGGMEYRSRVSLERESGSAAEGALLALEVVPAGTRFHFELIVPDPHSGLERLLLAQARRMADEISLGGGRTLGLGRFTLVSAAGGGLGQRLEKLRAEFPAPAARLGLRCATPYILSDGAAPWRPAPEVLADQFGRDLHALADRLKLPAPRVARVDAQIRPDFVGRWSFADGERSNRLTAWPGSRFTLEFAPGGIEPGLLAAARLFGLGEWSECGFGRFTLEEEMG